MDNENFATTDNAAQPKEGSQSGSDYVEKVEEEVGPMCCDPRQNYFRFGGLFFMCFLGFGSYFCYDTPGSLQDQIKEDMGVNTVQFASLYSLYSWPNVILCFVGGFLIDRFANAICNNCFPVPGVSFKVKNNTKGKNEDLAIGDSPFPVTNRPALLDTPSKLTSNPSNN